MQEQLQKISQETQRQKRENLKIEKSVLGFVQNQKVTCRIHQQNMERLVKENSLYMAEENTRNQKTRRDMLIGDNKVMEMIKKRRTPRSQQL